MNEKKHDVCPASKADHLSHWVRKIFQNPKKILKPYVRQGMTAVDLGCGPGFFTLPLAEMVGAQGRVIAVDLQKEMLAKLEQKIQGLETRSRIKLHQSGKNSLGVKTKADFVLAFYLVHEVPDAKKFFQQAKSLMKPKAKLLLVEPSHHVSAEEFRETLALAESQGFKVLGEPKVFWSRAVLLGV